MRLLGPGNPPNLCCTSEKADPFSLRGCEEGAEPQPRRDVHHLYLLRCFKVTWKVTWNVTGIPVLAKGVMGLPRWGPSPLPGQSCAQDPVEGSGKGMGREAPLGIAPLVPEQLRFCWSKNILLGRVCKAQPRTIKACASCWGEPLRWDRCQRFDTALLYLNVHFTT